MSDPARTEEHRHAGLAQPQPVRLLVNDVRVDSDAHGVEKLTEYAHIKTDDMRLEDASVPSSVGVGRTDRG